MHGQAALAGKVTLFTGAGRGIGAAITEGLAAAGAAVVCAARSEAEILATIARIEAARGRAVALPTDVAEPAEVATLYAATMERAEGLDLLFVNVGVSLDQRPV
jgi:3-oxoacyl-[acyl-carrier protein] reductase